MKTLIKFVFLLVFLNNSELLIAQTTAGNNLPVANRFLGYNGGGFDLQFRTDNLTRMTLTQTTGRLGLGTSTPNSIFHLSTTATGDLFRTDGPTAGINRWQLFTGGTERFRLYSDAGTSPFMAMRSLSNGLRFETGGSDIRMRSFSHLHSTKCA